MATSTSMLLCDQRTEEWRQARCGKVTASMISDLLAKGRGSKESTGRANYRAQILAEILTGKPCDDQFVSRFMQWGIDQEPFARAAYEMERDTAVETVGFVEHPRIECFGCSPDGLVGSDGLIQIKCPLTATHIDWLLKGEVPTEHQPQMLAEMACTGRAWCDFVSFDPRLPRELQLFVVRFPRDEARIQEIEEQVEKFLAEVKDVLAKLSSPRTSESLETHLRKSLEVVTAVNVDKAQPQPVVAAIEQAKHDEVEAQAPVKPRARRSAPVTVLDPQPDPKPKIDDVDPRTGQFRFAKYQDWVEAKDEWLQRDTLRQIERLMHQRPN